jgi:hypothetical protein
VVDAQVLIGVNLTMQYIYLKEENLGSEDLEKTGD